MRIQTTQQPAAAHCLICAKGGSCTKETVTERKGQPQRIVAHAASDAVRVTAMNRAACRHIGGLKERRELAQIVNGQKADQPGPRLRDRQSQGLGKLSAKRGN